jgi:translation initiation factor 3 subunit I
MSHAKSLFDTHLGEKVLSNKRANMDIVMDLQLSTDQSYFITGSKDNTAHIHNTKSLTVLKTFSTKTPLNSTVLTPNIPYVHFPPFPWPYRKYVQLEVQRFSWGTGKR